MTGRDRWIGANKSERIRWTRRAARNSTNWKFIENLVGKPKKKRILKKNPDINICLKEIVCVAVNYI